MDQNIVLPGQLLSENAEDSGSGTYVKDGKVYSLLYGILDNKKKVTVVPFSGKYIPVPKDLVIGTVMEVTPSNWVFDINSPYVGLMHLSEYPARIDQSKMTDFLGVGDSAILQIKDVSMSMKVELTITGRNLKTLNEGRIVEIKSTRVPYIIGKGGSVISMLKKKFNCDIFVGQNGRIWINGKDEDMDYLEKAIKLIVQKSYYCDLNNNNNEILQLFETESSEQTGTEGSDNSQSEEKSFRKNSKNHDTPEDTCRKIDALLDPSHD